MISRDPLTSIRRVVLKLTADQVLVFDWIVGACQVNLLKTGQIVREPVNANPSLKVNISPTQMFFAALFCVYGDH